MFSNHAGLNITESKLQLVEICFKENTFYLENVDQALHKEQITPDMSYEVLIEILRESFEKIVKKKPLDSSNVSFALPNNFFKIFEVPYEESMVKKDLLDHFKWELSVLYPAVNAEDYLIQHIEVNKSIYRKEKHAIVFGIDRMLVNSINNFCAGNNLILKYVDNVHLASNAFLYLEKSEIPSEVSLSFHIGQKYSSISAIDGVAPFYFRVLNPNVANIFSELSVAIKDLQDLGIRLDEFKKVLLFGQDVAEDFENRLKSFFNLPLKKVNPFAYLRASESVKNNPFYKLKSNSFSAATGIAIRII
jgi:Tfp pilus assembly PilM family ATPase